LSAVAPERDEADEMPEAGRLGGPRTQAVAIDYAGHFVVVGNHIVELATDGQVWEYHVNGHAIEDAHYLSFGEQDRDLPQARFVAAIGHWILGITNEGVVWGREALPTWRPRFRLDGPPVAHNPGDHFVVTIGNWLLVITAEGQVWWHAMTIDKTIRDAVRLDGPPVACNPGDHFVVTMGLRILVITTEGQVWGHDLNGFPPTIGPAFRLDGPPVANNPGDQYVLTMGGNRILVITNDGQLWGHDVNDTSIGQAFKFYFDP